MRWYYFNLFLYEILCVDVVTLITAPVRSFFFPEPKAFLPDHSNKPIARHTTAIPSRPYPTDAYRITFLRTKHQNPPLRRSSTSSFFQTIYRTNRRLSYTSGYTYRKTVQFCGLIWSIAANDHKDIWPLSQETRISTAVVVPYPAKTYCTLLNPRQQPFRSFYSSMEKSRQGILWYYKRTVANPNRQSTRPAANR